MDTNPSYASRSTTRAARLVLCGALVAALGAAGCGPSDGGAEAVDTWTASSDGGLSDGAETGTERDGSEEDAGDAGDVEGDEPGLVPTSEGPVRGTRTEGGEIWSFRGIPYAKPPTGDLRWRAPRDPEPRDSVFEADAYGPACPQSTSGSSVSDPGPTDEDCLTLNVWTPEPDPSGDRPVMVWLHGGGFIQGSSRVSYPGGTDLYAGGNLAEQDVVIVTLNYRLGPLGFLAHSDLVGEDSAYGAAGNYGFLDQVAALEWVRDNIEAFGGNPDDVTLFGESAGAISACGHLAAQRSRGLFDRVVMQSGSCPLYLRHLDEKQGETVSALDQGERIARKLGCEGEGISCLRSKSTEEIFDAISPTIGRFGDGEQFGPIVDGEVFQQTFWESMENGDVADVPLLAGTNADEGTLFAQSYRGYTEQQYRDWVNDNFSNRAEGVLNEYPPSDYSEPWRAIAAIIGDTFFTCPTRWALRAHVAHGHRAFGYLFSHVTPYGSRNNLGSFHGSELTFVFGNFIRGTVPQSEIALSNRMQSYWTQFATEGDPGSEDDLDWPNYSLADDQLLEFQTPEPTTRSGYRKAKCEFWAQ